MTYATMIHLADIRRFSHTKTGRKKGVARSVVATDVECYLEPITDVRMIGALGAGVKEAFRGHFPGGTDLRPGDEVVWKDRAESNVVFYDDFRTESWEWIFSPPERFPDLSKWLFVKSQAAGIVEVGSGEDHNGTGKGSLNLNAIEAEEVWIYMIPTLAEGKRYRLEYFISYADTTAYDFYMLAVHAQGIPETYNRSWDRGVLRYDWNQPATPSPPSQITFELWGPFYIREVTIDWVKLWDLSSPYTNGTVLQVTGAVEPPLIDPYQDSSVQVDLIRKAVS